MAAPCCPICSRRYCAVSRHLWTPFVLPLSRALFDLRVAWLFRSDPPGLVLREQLGRRSPARLLLEIEIAEILPAGVFHDEGIVADLFDRPGRREAPQCDRHMLNSAFDLGSRSFFDPRLGLLG